MTARIFLKLIVSVLLVMVVALTTIDFLASQLAERAYIDGLRIELEEKIRMLAVIEAKQIARLDVDAIRNLAQAAGGRITYIQTDGRVLLDSDADAGRMENHLGRPEVQMALRNQAGWDVRESSTLHSKFLYVAGPVPSGVARIAVPLTAVNTQIGEIRKRLVMYTGLAFLPAIALAAFFARFFSKKLGSIIHYANALARGDFHARLAQVGTDELGTLGTKLVETGGKLQKMFQELEKEHSEMEKLERIRKDFVINVSHELRTPLASIQGYTETLLDGAIHDQDNNLRFLNIIRQNAERLGRLTGDLLTLSRIELKTQKLQFASYYVNALLADCVDSIRPMATKKSVNLVVDSAPPETEVFCDAESVHQVMTNLLDNALKYTPEHGCITVTVNVLAAAEVEVGVKDTGIGIPSEDLPRLFERFYRVDKARSRELGGTGLGLAIVKHLVRAQGGEVRVESTLGQGSTFFFTLPTEDRGLPEMHGGSSSLQEQFTRP